MRLAALFSGGKDSSMAIYRAMQKGHEVTCLVTMLPETPESYMFHYPNVEWTTYQGKCMGIPVVQKKTAGIKEKELNDMKEALSGLDVEGVVSGALASRYQKARVDRITKELGLKSYAPLWQKGDKRLFRQVLELGFEIIMAGVAAEGLDETWLGRTIDYEAVDELSEMGHLHIMFEGGEAETFVLDGPMFHRRLAVASAEKKWDGMRGEYAITGLRILPKE